MSTTHTRPASYHYIGIGEDSHFYTLRYATPEPKYRKDALGRAIFLGYEWRHSHVQNLSQNPEQAQARALELTGLELELPGEDELDEIRRRSAEQIAREKREEQARKDAALAELVDMIFYAPTWEQIKARKEQLKQAYRDAVAAAGADAPQDDLLDMAGHFNHKLGQLQRWADDIAFAIYADLRAAVELAEIDPAWVLAGEAPQDATPEQARIVDILSSTAARGYNSPTAKQTAYVGSLAEGHGRTVAKQAAQAALEDRLNGQHFGTPGERLEADVEVIDAHGFDGTYGWTTIVTLLTANGELLKWFSSNPKEFGEIGFTGRARMTVKRHTDYQGANETHVNRVSAV